MTYRTLDKIEHHVNMLDKKGFTERDLEQLKKIAQDIQKVISLKQRFLIVLPSSAKRSGE